MVQFAASVYPVVMAGGFGSRLWPLSREAFPKHLLKLAGDRTLLQETVLRAKAVCGNLPSVITNEVHRFTVAAQLQEVMDRKCPIVLEAVGRSTAMAAAEAALLVRRADPHGIVLLLPSDHFIGDIDFFRSSVASAIDGAHKGYIMTFGVVPSRPEAGYGYIKVGEKLGDTDGCFAISRFLEKPASALAKLMIEQGGYLWNAGMFAFRPDVLLEEMERFEPDVKRAAVEAVGTAVADLDFLRLGRAAMEAAPSISLDHAVMERTRCAGVTPLQAEWADLGSWKSILDLSEQDASGNVIVGDVVMHDVKGSLIRSDGILTAVVGLENIVVVATGDAVLVVHKDKTQDVRRVVKVLERQDRRELREGELTQRPWGSFERIACEENYQVKQITLKVGASISLQLHHKRAEHWVVVKGVARVTRGDQVLVLGENQSTYIPPLMLHRLENAGSTPLRIIEVQSGSYLGEDDIVRFEDSYGRAAHA